MLELIQAPRGASNLAKPHLDIGLVCPRRRSRRFALLAGRGGRGVRPCAGVRPRPAPASARPLRLGPEDQQFARCRGPMRRRPATSELLVARAGAGGAEVAQVDPEGNRVTPRPAGDAMVSRRSASAWPCATVDAHRGFLRRGAGLAEETVEGAGRRLPRRRQHHPARPSGRRARPTPRSAVTAGATSPSRSARSTRSTPTRWPTAPARAAAPVTLGETARISMIRDPDGNWIELSQRAIDRAGSLEPSALSRHTAGPSAFDRQGRRVAEAGRTDGSHASCRVLRRPCRPTARTPHSSLTPTPYFPLGAPDRD